MGAQVRNASDSPVYDVTLIFGDAGGGGAGPLYKDVGVLPSGDQQEFFAPDGTFPPGATADAVLALYVVVTFIDSNGVAWHRDHRGKLTEGAYVHPAGGPLVPWADPRPGAGPPSTS